MVARTQCGTSRAMGAGMHHSRVSFFSFIPISVLGVLVAACSSSPQDDVGSTSEGYTLPSPGNFSLPPSDANARAAILARYTQIDPNGVVPRGLLEDAIEYFDVNQAQIPNRGYLVVVDFSKFSGDWRFFLVNMHTGAVEKHKVAHGHNSDPNQTGYAHTFSNTSGSLMSSLGFYMGGEISDGSHPHSMRLDGLSKDGSPNHMANTNVRERAVVMHEASYVDDASSGVQGRSDGCLALDPSIEVSVVNRLTGGAIIYAETGPLNPPIGRGSPPPPTDAGTHDSGNTGASCSKDGDCNPGSDGAGKICVQGTCVPGCNANWECPGSTTCVHGQCK